MQLPPNKFKRGLAKGELQIGLWSSLCSPITSELIGYSGFDWIVLDMEHSPNDVPMILAQLQAMAAGGTSVVVRPAWNDMVMIKRVLDIGAQTIILPYVQNAEEARKAVEYVRYPQAGVRGAAGGTRASAYGRIKDYMQKVDEETCILVQVETIDAIGQLEDIAKVDGIDGIFVGPSDLSASMGHLGNAAHSDVQSVIKQAAITMANCGIPSGILGVQEEAARQYIEWGYKFVAVGNDTVVLANAADSLCRRFKG
ncbi:MAG: HpcH/HpaI aldolase/citrate lyase family protein [Rhizobiaceae bacterium]|nr:HpcH/HpaI aldolase/citrate lyase family protein [Rhizobiaceae bacterium]